MTNYYHRDVVYCDNVLIKNKIGNFVGSLQIVQISDYDVVQGKLSVIWLTKLKKQGTRVHELSVCEDQCL